LTDVLDIASLQNDFAMIDMINRPERQGARFRFLEALLLKKEQIKLKMYQEKGHGRPHFHVDYGPQNHAASYAIDTGERIEGDLHRKYDRAIGPWVEKNRDTLLRAWGALQSGQPEQEFVMALSALES
jgi:hypothetical protein